ncbi:MAG: DEAD/DEAH box helicase family protein [Methanobrevibacter sp.]|jgi:type I restriction enzyme R subunit|nr:DEAD/DEAH box helicase family protein [Candidatus Methanovirga procula]
MKNSKMSQELTEEDIKNRFITPAIEKSGWKKEQVRMEYSFTDGRIIVQGEYTKRGKIKKADYLLFYTDNTPLAIEAKNNNYSVGYGIQQGIEYAKILDVPFVYSSNSDGFVEHDMLRGIEKDVTLNEFPRPEDLWDRYINAKNIDSEIEETIKTPYYFSISNRKNPRYYQRIAINRTVEAIAKGENRILLVMATGTGKTYTAFQIVYRLKEAGLKKKVLYLADRNILIDQTMQNDFKSYEKVMTKIQKRMLDSSYEIYFGLYQQLSEYEGRKPYLEFKPDFFDLIIVDECHRGSAKEESQWREILEYFHTATQIGMTATPKETKKVSNISYFGEPIYTYSLKEGMNDGFLAPYKVIRVGLDKDLEGYRPGKGKKDIYGNEIEDREYNTNDYDKHLIIDDRTKKVAERITKFLKRKNRFSKTIAFCVDIDHGERLRQALVNENSDLIAENPKYIVKITGDDKFGKSQLDYFIDSDEKYPTVVTTSKLLSTGIDCKTCKLIVLDNNINSMTEFKQIIGRGTRLEIEKGKEYFTIMDFRGSTRLFADPEFDGEPVNIIDWNEGESPSERSKNNDESFDEGFSNGKKFRVNDIPVKILSEKVQCYDKDGNLITESIVDYSKRNILDEYRTIDKFLLRWNKETRKQIIIDELQERGVFLEEIKQESGKYDMDEFDLFAILLLIRNL